MHHCPPRNTNGPIHTLRQNLSHFREQVELSAQQQQEQQQQLIHGGFQAVDGSERGGCLHVRAVFK